MGQNIVSMATFNLKKQKKNPKRARNQKQQLCSFDVSH